MGRLSLRDCKASFLRTMPSALVPWDFLRLSWKPVTPGDDSWPCALLVGSKGTGESGKSDSGPFWQASTLLFISKLPSSFGTSLMLILVAGKESFSELRCKPLHLSLHLHPKTMLPLLPLECKNTEIANDSNWQKEFYKEFLSLHLKRPEQVPLTCITTVPSSRSSKVIIKYLQNLTRVFKSC